MEHIQFRMSDANIVGNELRFVDSEGHYVTITTTEQLAKLISKKTDFELEEKLASFIEMLR